MTELHNTTCNDHHAELHHLIEQMNDYQAELVLSFIKTLFGLTD